MKLFFIVLIIFLFSVIGCQNNDYIVIDTKSDSCTVLELDPVFEQTVFSIKDIVDTMRVIALETTSASILSRVDFVKISGEYVVIKDYYQKGNIAIFDTTGKFVCRLPQGNGPGEIDHVSSFDVDDHYLYVLQRVKVNKYSLDGVFIESYPVVEMHDMYFNGIKVIDGGFLLSIHPCDSKMRKYEVIHTDSEFMKKNHFVFDHHFAGYRGGEDFMMLQNKIVFFPTLSNTVYQFDGKIFRPLYMLNYPKHTNTFEKNPNCSGDSPDFVRTHCILNKYFPGGRIFRSSSVLFLLFEDGFRNIYVFIDSKSGKYKSGFFNMPKDDDISVWILSNFQVEYSFNDYLVQVLPPEYGSYFGNDLEEFVAKLQHISDEDRQKILNAKDDDNPLIIMYKLKSIE